MTMKRLIVAIMTVSLLAGHAAGQKKDQRPAVNAPDTFRGADTTAPTDQTSIGDLKWFEVFKDGELQNLVRTAMAQNYDLRAAVARINAARANLGLARSDQFPQFGAGAELRKLIGPCESQVGARRVDARDRRAQVVILGHRRADQIL